MKIVTNYTLQVTSYTLQVTRYKIVREKSAMMKGVFYICFLLSAFCLLPSALTAQIEKKELKLTPEMEEMVVAKIKNLPEKDYSDYGITDRSRLMNLHLVSCHYYNVVYFCIFAENFCYDKI